MLYSRDWHNLVNQLYFNLIFLKEGEFSQSPEKKHLENAYSASCNFPSNVLIIGLDMHQSQHLPKKDYKNTTNYCIYIAWVTGIGQSSCLFLQNNWQFSCILPTLKLEYHIWLIMQIYILKRKKYIYIGWINTKALLDLYPISWDKP